MTFKNPYTKTIMNKLCKELVEEELETYIEKAHSMILMTKGKVIKIYDKLSPQSTNSLIREYEWDKKMRYLCPQMIANYLEFENRNILIMNRLPSNCNVCFMLNHGDLSVGDIEKIITHICRFELPITNVSFNELYYRWRNNILLQIEQLYSHLDSKTIEALKEFVKSVKETLFEFSKSNNRIRFVHGNMFSHNVFLYKDDIIIIDPISQGHIVSISDSLMDISTFFVDVSIFSNEDITNDLRRFIEKSFTSTEKLIFKLYFVLKLLVRLRFAYLECAFHNSENNQANEIVIRHSEKIILMELLDE